jgi:hypothetical protein
MPTDKKFCFVSDDDDIPLHPVKFNTLYIFASIMNPYMYKLRMDMCWLELL